MDKARREAVGRAASIVAEMIEARLDQGGVGPDILPILLSFKVEMQRRAGIGLTPKQQLRELRRDDPTNPAFWTAKQKRKAAQKGKAV